MTNQTEINIESNWLQAFKVPSPYSKVAPDQNTVVDIVSAKPVIQVMPGKTNDLIHGQADNAQYGQKGYINKEYDEVIYKILQKAQEEQKNVIMRFEKFRLPEAGSEATIEELTVDRDTARGKIINVLAGIYDVNNRTWVKTQNMTTEPDNDPPEFEEWLNKWVIPTVRNSDIDPESFFQAKQDEAPEPVPPAREVYNSNKKNELDKTRILINFYTHVMKVNHEKELGFSKEYIEKLSTVLLVASNGLYKLIENQSYINYGAYSHTCARSIVFSLTETTHPFPSEDQANLKEYAKSLLIEGKTIIDFAKNPKGNNQEEQ